MKILIFLLFITIQFAEAKKDIFFEIDQIHPTQFVIGNASIPIKIEEIEKKFTKRKLKKYLIKKKAPAILGPDNKVYVVDRHHFIRALYESNIPENSKKVYVKIIKDFRNRSFKKFSSFMIKNNYVYLKATGRESRTFYELPTHIRELENDPYRSLSWLVREKGGYQKVSVPFLEFYWAEFFYRNGITIINGKITNEIVSQTMKLAKSKEASHLPGFIEGKTKCRESLLEILK